MIIGPKDDYWSMLAVYPILQRCIFPSSNVICPITLYLIGPKSYPMWILLFSFLVYHCVCVCWFNVLMYGLVQCVG